VSSQNCETGATSNCGRSEKHCPGLTKWSLSNLLIHTDSQVSQRCISPQMLETLYNVISLTETIMSIVHLLVSLWSVCSEGRWPGVDKLYITPKPILRAKYL